MVWFYEQKAKRNWHGLLGWVVSSLYALGAVVLFANGLPLLGQFLAVLAACFFTARLLSRSFQVQLLSTAEINGWI
jgi:membrane protein YqaA with SNARE-associated domain